MFQKSDFGQLSGGASASTWLAGAAPAPSRPLFQPHDWRERVRQWAEDVDLVPDLGLRVGSLDWWRGLATLAALIVVALQLAPGFAPLPARPEPLMADSRFEVVRSQMITPLALGADSGRHMGPTDMVVPLAQTPERPQIELSTVIGNGDTLARALSRAGVNGADSASVGRLLAGAIGTLEPGTRLNIVLGRRASRSVPRPLDSLAFRARLDLAVEIGRQDGALTLKRIPIAVDDTPLRVRGRVGDSLYRAARAAGAPASAVQEYLRVLGQHISIASLGADDSFDIVLAHRRAETGETESGALMYAGLERANGKKVQLLKWTSEGRADWFEASGVGERRGVMSAPVAARRISSGFGMRRHPLLGYSRMHSGIDYAAAYGTPVHAATDGRIVSSGWHGGHGRYVKIDHGGGIATGYAHLSRIVADRGDRVRRGQVIGYVGSTGLSTGPHLHYELFRRGRAVDPRSVSFTSTARLSGGELAAFRGRMAQLTRLPVGLPAAPAGAPVRSAAKDGPTEIGASAARGEIAFLPNGRIRHLN